MGAIHPPAQGRGGLKAHGPLSIRVAVLAQGAGRETSSSAGNSPHCSFSFFFYFKQNSLTMEILPPPKKPSRPSQHAGIAHTAAVSAFPSSWKSP